MASDNAVVIAGEAEESDVEEDVVPAVHVEPGRESRPPLIASQVSGEAQESSDDDVNNESSGGITPLKVDVHQSSGDRGGEADQSSRRSSDSKQSSTSIEPKPYKFDTLLHRKLRERNVNLRRQLELLKTGTYSKASKDIQIITQQLIKSQAAIQDVTNNMRMMTNDLFQLEDRIDIVCSCNILPDIRLPGRAEPTGDPESMPSTSAAAPGAGTSAVATGASTSAVAPGASTSAVAPGASTSAVAPGASTSPAAPGADTSAAAPGAGTSAVAPGASTSAVAPGADTSAASSGTSTSAGPGAADAFASLADASSSATSAR